jgi:hypothetical protein
MEDSKYQNSTNKSNSNIGFNPQGFAGTEDPFFMERELKRISSINEDVSQEKPNYIRKSKFKDFSINF